MHMYLRPSRHSSEKCFGVNIAARYIGWGLLGGLSVEVEFEGRPEAMGLRRRQPGKELGDRVSMTKGMASAKALG